MYNVHTYTYTHAYIHVYIHVHSTYTMIHVHVHILYWESNPEPLTSTTSALTTELCYYIYIYM